MLTCWHPSAIASGNTNEPAGAIGPPHIHDCMMVAPRMALLKNVALVEASSPVTLHVREWLVLVFGLPTSLSCSLVVGTRQGHSRRYPPEIETWRIMILFMMRMTSSSHLMHNQNRHLQRCKV